MWLQSLVIVLGVLLIACGYAAWRVRPKPCPNDTSTATDGGTACVTPNKEASDGTCLTGTCGQVSNSGECLRCTPYPDTRGYCYAAWGLGSLLIALGGGLLLLAFLRDKKKPSAE